MSERLSLDLPDSWQLGAWPDPGGPMLSAALYQVARYAGEPRAIVMASLTAWGFATDSLPAAVDMEPRVARQVEVAPGVPADFLVATYPVVSADGSVTVLLTFSTPNLPYREAMLRAFASIATTARLEPAP